MPSIFQTHLLQQLSKHRDLLATPPSDSKPIQWRGRSISETDEVRTELQQLLKRDEHEDKNNSQLLERICTLCNVDESHKSFLKSFCKTSPQEVAKALTEAIVDTAREEKQVDEAFNQELQEWVEDGEEGEERVEAAEKITQAYLANSTELDLSYLNLKTIPDGIKRLTNLTELNLSCNTLTDLPDIFDALTNLCTINLDYNPISHFPEVLYSINREFSVSILDTPMLNTKITPGLERKLSEYQWEIDSDNSNIFNSSKNEYLAITRAARDNHLEPEELSRLKQITNSNSENIEEQVKQLFSESPQQIKTRITNQQDLDRRLATTSFENIRLVSCNNNSPINIFCCEHPPRVFPKEAPLEIDSYLNTIKFIHNEVDTMMSLIERDNQNEVVPFLKHSAGDNFFHPTKVLSMPIPDLSPPRCHHFLTLAKEMSTPQSSKMPKGILLFCNAGRGRSGTLLTAAKMIDKFKNMDSGSKNQLLDMTRNFTPDIFGGWFPFLEENIKTTQFIGNLVQSIRQIEQETTTDKEGRAIETSSQFRSLELLQYVLIMCHKINENPNISDSEILETINQENIPKEILERFFQIDYTKPKNQMIIEAIKQIHEAISTE